MGRRDPAMVRAEVLSRIHYGLPSARPSLSGREKGIHLMVAAKLESWGFLRDGRLTESGYLELAETCRRLNADKGTENEHIH